MRSLLYAPVVIAVEYLLKAMDPATSSPFVEDTPLLQPTVISSTVDETPRQQKCLDTTMSLPYPPPETCRSFPASSVPASMRSKRRSSGGEARAVTKGVADMMWPPGGERKAVLYFTSLRGVRKMFMDCCTVRSILRSYSARVDISMSMSMDAMF